MRLILILALFILWIYLDVYSCVSLHLPAAQHCNNYWEEWPPNRKSWFDCIDRNQNRRNRAVNISTRFYDNAQVWPQRYRHPFYTVSPPRKVSRLSHVVFPNCTVSAKEVLFIFISLKMCFSDIPSYEIFIMHFARIRTVSWDIEKVCI